MTRKKLLSSSILAATTALSALAPARAPATCQRSRPALSPTCSAPRPSFPASSPTGFFPTPSAAMPGVGLITWALDYSVDRTRKDVTVTLLGLGKSHAVFRGEGLGCYLDHGGAVADIALPAMEAKPCAVAAGYCGPIGGRAAEPQLARRARPCLCRAGQAAAPSHQGDCGGEGRPCYRRALCRRRRHRYAAARLLRDQIGDLGAGRHHGAQGRADTRSAGAGRRVAKPRRSQEAITLDHLLRHTAGLALGSSLSASLASALEPVNRMKFMESRHGGLCREHAARNLAGQLRGIITDGNTVILAHLIRTRPAAAASDLMRFARQELFGPLGMRHVDARVRRLGQCRKDRARCW